MSHSPIPHTPDLVTQQEAADKLDVCPRTIRRYVADGRLTAYRLGPRLIRIDASELDRLLREIPIAGRAR